jgi:hypothetical protein
MLKCHKLPDWIVRAKVQETGPNLEYHFFVRRSRELNSIEQLFDQRNVPFLGMLTLK